jgi:hypothetical protein
MPRNRCSIPDRGKKFIFSPQRPERHSDPLTLRWVARTVSLEIRLQEVKLAVRLHAVPTLRMRAAIPPLIGRAIAQVVSRWLPTAAAWVRSCGICGEQSGTGAGFLRVLRFPLPIFIPPIGPQSPSSIIWGWYNRPVVAAVPSGLSLTPLRIIYPHSPVGPHGELLVNLQQTRYNDLSQC